jgi:predicted RNase H-like HicB family nuclease
MRNVVGSQSIYRSKGLTIRPVRNGWKSIKTLVYARSFEFEVEKDERGWFVGTVKELPGCHTQARTEDELVKRLQEAVELALEESVDPLSKSLFSSKRRK